MSEVYLKVWIVNFFSREKIHFRLCEVTGNKENIKEIHPSGD